MNNVVKFPKKNTDIFENRVVEFVFRRALDSMFLFGYSKGFKNGVLIGVLISAIFLYNGILLLEWWLS